MDCGNWRWNPIKPTCAKTAVFSPWTLLFSTLKSTVDDGNVNPVSKFCTLSAVKQPEMATRYLREVLFFCLLMDSYVRKGNGSKNVFCVGLKQTLHNCTLYNTNQYTFFEYLTELPSIALLVIMNKSCLLAEHDLNY